MKKQNDFEFITDWQTISYSGTELDNHRETDGIEEETEYGFFNFGREDHKNQREDTISTKSA
jgi:hypothetical protein